MTQAIPLPFDLPAVARKKLTVDFGGGNQPSDAGLLLLRGAERRIGIIARMASALRDHRDPSRITHQLAEIIGARVFGLACGYEDGVDHNALRNDPAMKMAVGRAVDRQPLRERADEEGRDEARRRPGRSFREPRRAGSS